MIGAIGGRLFSKAGVASLSSTRTSALGSTSRGNGLARVRFFSTKPSPAKDGAKPATKTKNPAPASKGAANKNATAKKGSKSNEKTIAEHLTKFILAAEDAKEYKPDFSEEELAEHARVGRIYQQKSTQRHNRLEKDLATKIWLQQDALRSLPEASGLRIHAETIDDTPPPADRPWPFFQTPPIKDFNARQFMGKKEDEDEDDGVTPAGETVAAPTAAPEK